MKFTFWKGEKINQINNYMVCYWPQKINLIKGVGSVGEGFAVLSNFTEK